MIRFSLSCKSGHKFEGWFAGNADYEKQNTAQLIACPVCGSVHVHKMLMAPHVVTGNSDKEEDAAKGEGSVAESVQALNRAEILQKLLVLQKMQKNKLDVLHKLQNLARKLRENAENVGSGFAEEARKMHYGEAKKRSVYGKAEGEEVESLLEEGIDVFPLPILPEDTN